MCLCTYEDETNEPGIAKPKCQTGWGTVKWASFKVEQPLRAFLFKQKERVGSIETWA